MSADRLLLAESQLPSDGSQAPTSFDRVIPLSRQGFQFYLCTICHLQRAFHASISEVVPGYRSCNLVKVMERLRG